jgi:hypothetical protein
MSSRVISVTEEETSRERREGKRLIFSDSSGCPTIWFRVAVHLLGDQA